MELKKLIKRLNRLIEADPSLAEAHVVTESHDHFCRLLTSGDIGRVYLTPRGNSGLYDVEENSNSPDVKIFVAIG